MTYQPEQVDSELIAALARLEQREKAEGWGDEEVVAAQKTLIETAAWLRGFRPPASWDEAWQRIDEQRAKGQLRSPGFGGT